VVSFFSDFFELHAFFSDEEVARFCGHFGGFRFFPSGAASEFSGFLEFREGVIGVFSWFWRFFRIVFSLFVAMHFAVDPARLATMPKRRTAQRDQRFRDR
jgi:hypothetical protein